VRPSTAYKWVHYGYVPYIKIGDLIRFNEQRILDWLHKKERAGRHTLKIPLELVLKDSHM